MNEDAALTAPAIGSIVQLTQRGQEIAVINGRPCMWGDLLLAIVRASPVFESISETTRNDEVRAEHYGPREKPDALDGVTAVCTVKRRGENPVVRTFSVRDARRAGLWAKEGPWQKYPRRMLQMRARGFAMRDCFADVLKGMTTREEAMDIDPSGAIEGENPRQRRLDIDPDAPRRAGDEDEDGSDDTSEEAIA